MLSAMSTARNITFCAYFIEPGGAVEQTLEDAAKRGAQVTVRLNGYFYQGRKAMLTGNKQAVRTLKALGADAKIVHHNDGDGPMMHLKAAVCDSVAFLDDRNWAQADDTVIRDTKRGDVDAVRRAASYVPASCDSVKLDKASALADESKLIRGARGHGVDVAVESVSTQGNLYSALLRLGRAGFKPHLLISKFGLRGKYGHAAELLQRNGVVVRVTSNCEKFAIAAGKRAWIGSANGTSSFRDAKQFEWGMRTNVPAIVRALQSRFNSAWCRAQPLPPEKS
jgi:phosphatidylserine/phosphatidylglycerophosphate/cardiolipin synthase-like enzyme